PRRPRRGRPGRRRRRGRRPGPPPPGARGGLGSLLPLRLPGLGAAAGPGAGADPPDPGPTAGAGRGRRPAAGPRAGRPRGAARGAGVLGWIGVVLTAAVLGYAFGFLDCSLAAAAAGEVRRVRWPGNDLRLAVRSLGRWLFAFLAGPVVAAAVGFFYWLHCGEV